MNKITDTHIAKFKLYLQNEERAAATVEKYLRDILAFRAWLGARGVDKRTALAYKERLIED